MLTYRYVYRGSRMIVYEYENGRRGHTYLASVAGNGIGVTLLKMKGGFDKYSLMPYQTKQINIYMIKPLVQKEVVPPPPLLIEKAPAQALPDNSANCGHQLKLI